MEYPTQSHVLKPKRVNSSVIRVKLFQESCSRQTRTNCVRQYQNGGLHKPLWRSQSRIINDSHCHLGTGVQTERMSLCETSSPHSERPCRLVEQTLQPAQLETTSRFVQVYRQYVGSSKYRSFCGYVKPTNGEVQQPLFRSPNVRGRRVRPIRLI